MKETIDIRTTYSAKCRRSYFHIYVVLLKRTDIFNCASQNKPDKRRQLGMFTLRFPFIYI